MERAAHAPGDDPLTLILDDAVAATTGDECSLKVRVEDAGGAAVQDVLLEVCQVGDGVGLVDSGTTGADGAATAVNCTSSRPTGN